MEKMKSQAALQNPVCVFVANDLNMGLGKTAAQVAHAYGKAWLDRFELVDETKDYVKLCPVPEAKKLLELGGVVPPKIIYCPASFLPEEGDYVTSITDSGRTVFTEPTKTVSASSSVLGVRVQEEKRLGYNVGEIPFKQAFFVNRKAVVAHAVSEDELIAELALMSFKHIIDEYDAVEGVLSLRKEDPLYRWLTSAFGKTVVGTKKDSKFQELHDLLKEDMVAVAELMIDGTLLGMCTEVLDSGSIHGYTKYKTFNLLSNL